MNDEMMTGSPVQKSNASMYKAPVTFNSKLRPLAAMKL